MDEETFAFGSFRLIPAQRILLEDGKPLRLGSRALDILVALVESAGETIRKDQLIARTWPDTVVDEGALRVHVAALRKALGDGRTGTRYIANIPGRGYSFIAPVGRERRQQASAPSNGAVVDGNLPAPLSRVVGRDDIIVALAAQLIQRRFLTIVGPGGIGKTTVAIAVAETVSASHRDGVWFVGLASLADPELVPSAFGATLGISLSSVDPVYGLTAWLRDKHALIVLDSCEHVVGTAATIAEEILRTAPHVCILATSREPLRAEGEWLHRLASLEVPPDSTDLATGDVLHYPAVELFNERAAAIVEGLSFGAAELPAVTEICRRLDGVPLALELAAAQVDVFGIKGLAAHLDDRFTVLTKGRRTALPRHQTLRAAMDWSYDLLPRAEQLILGRLAVFQGSFTTEAAAAVAKDDRIKTADVLEGVANLAMKSLVATDISGEITYHRLLDTTRAYAWERLTSSGEVERVRRLHAEYYRDLFELAEGEWETRPTAEWMADYGHQIDNVRAALDWASSPGGDWSIGVALTAASVPLWMHQSLIDECRTRVERALAGFGAERNDPRHEMKLYAARAASLMYAKGPVPEANAVWADALRVAESLDDAEYQLRALWGLCVYRLYIGEYALALALAQRYSQLAADKGDASIALIGTRTIGTALHYLGDQPNARHHLEEMLARYKDPAHRSHTIRFQFDQRVTARVTLAQVLWLQGFPDQATRTAQDAVNDAEAADHAISLCNALAQAACPVALYVGDLAAADRLVGMLLDHSARHSLDLWHVLGRCWGGVLHIRRGDVVGGLPLLRASLRGLRQTGFALRYPAFRGALAEGLAAAGQAREALAIIDETLALIDSTGEQWCLAELLRLNGEFVLLENATDAVARAEDLFRQALAWAERQGALSWELRAATSLARLWRDQHRVAEARELLAPMYGRFTEGFATTDPQRAKRLLERMV